MGTRGEPLILSVTDGSGLVGHVPLSIEGRTACFMGLADVCDYQDIVARPEHAAAVMAAAAAHLRSEGITRMDLQTLRPDALALQALDTLAGERVLAIETIPHQVTYETRLPAHWEDYLMQLSGKQRHEVRRKIRRLEAHGSYRYRPAAGEDTAKGIETFLRLFQLNRSDKAAFMDPAMSGYFRALMQALAQENMLHIGILEVADTPAAAVLCFDFNGVRYLYNSGYDARFQDLSVGVVGKILSIRNGIETGCRTYDFLKGAEAYKKRIGGRQIGLFRCKVTL